MSKKKNKVPRGINAGYPFGLDITGYDAALKVQDYVLKARGLGLLHRDEPMSVTLAADHTDQPRLQWKCPFCSRDYDLKFEIKDISVYLEEEKWAGSLICSCEAVLHIYLFAGEMKPSK